MTQRPKLGLLALLAATTLAQAGCGEEADTRAAPDAVSQATAGAPLTVDTVPRVRIGRPDGTPEEVLNRVVSPFVLPDGRLVIPIGGDSQVRVYSAEGVLDTVYGREGAGPGEFVSIGGAWPVGDTIEVHDWGTRRITRLLDGAMEVVTLRPEGSAESSVGRVGTGWLLAGLVNAGPTRAEAGAPSFKRDTVAYRLFARDGSDLGEVTRVPGLTRYMTPQGRTQPEPLAPEDRSATYGDLFVVGETLEPRLVALDSTGSTRHEIRWQPSVQHDPESSLRSVLELERSREDRNPNLPPMDRSDAPVPDRVSVFWGLLVDELGFVWVLPYDPPKHAQAMGGWRGPGPGGRWMVFTLDGERVADVEMPPRLYPSQITRDVVVGIERDRYGVESVAVFTLHRR